jgi:hypothetical protein
MYELVVGSTFLGQSGSWFKREMEPPEMWAFRNVRCSGKELPSFVELSCFALMVPPFGATLALVASPGAFVPTVGV